MEDNSQALDDRLHWYKDAIIYELHIKAFCDGNGDGVGDFQGLLSKLDYLQDLGVTAIWVLPFYPSPLRDDGYDIADYYQINPSYGNIRQFKQLLQEAHQRGLKVITELVINHTSDQHPWFQRARIAPKGSPERNFYVWTDDPHQYKDVRIIFQDFETSNWTWDPVAQQYYWHRFFHHQPDLNYDNPLVQEEVFRMIDYWCGMGVDGFRLDAVPYLFEREGTNGENLPETHAFLKRLRRHVDDHFPGTVFLAEANMWPEDSASYFGDGDECHMNYHFPVMPRMFMALQMEDRYPITDIFDQTPAIPPTCQWAMFLRNHDELTLEMVTDEERDYMYKAYAKDPKARINLGIRHRLAPLMENNRRKIELINSLLFSLPGTPVIYYGDEIGMGDNFYLGDRDGVRTPMQWSPDRNAGFSSSNPHRLYLPLILDPEYHYEAVNVETQRRNTSSLFWYMKRIISTRKQYRAFGRGQLNFLNVNNPKVLAFTRQYENETLLIVVNLSKFSQVAEVELEQYKGFTPVELMSRNRFPAIGEQGTFFFTLSPHAYLWFSLEKQQAGTSATRAMPQINVALWDDLLHNEHCRRLQSLILPLFFSRSKWFNGNGRSIYSLDIVRNATIPLSQEQVSLWQIEVSYESGLPETYSLMTTFVKEEQAKKISDNCPQAVIASMQMGQEEGLLCDALFIPGLQRLLLTYMAHQQHIALPTSELVFSGSEQVARHVQEQQDIKPRIHGADPAQTSVTFDNRFFLKMYRKADPGINPDVEITRYLSEEARFQYTPPFLGTIEWKFENDTIVLGMLQTMIENHGDGRSFMTERLHNYIERVLAREQEDLLSYGLKGSLVDPVPFEQLPDPQKDLLGAHTADQIRLIGIRTGQMHLALASGHLSKELAPEEFSLHYQRSLFSAMQSLVRESFQTLRRNIKVLPDNMQAEAEDILNRKQDILNLLKRIYHKKFDVIRCRIHGNYHLAQVLLTGKDVSIQDFGGNPSRPYSERRLKRSPLRDVATMLRSLHNLAYEAFFLSNQVPAEKLQRVIPFARLWAHYIGGFFMRAYLDTVRHSSIVPEDPDDLRVMLQTYLLEKAIFDLNQDLMYRPGWAIVSIRTIQSILK